MRTTIVATMMLALASPGIAKEEPTPDQVRRTSDQIQFASYPRDALKRGEEGSVGIRVTTDKEGRLRDCIVTRSSGFRSLDEASCDMLLSNLHMKPFLAPDGRSIVRTQDGQVVWKLPEGAAAKAVAPTKPVAVAANPATRKICRTQTKTGSLVSSQRICLTRAEWDAQYIHAQEETREMRPHMSLSN